MVKLNPNQQNFFADQLQAGLSDKVEAAPVVRDIDPNARNIENQMKNDLGGGIVAGLSGDLTHDDIRAEEVTETAARIAETALGSKSEVQEPASEDVVFVDNSRVAREAAKALQLKTNSEGLDEVRGILAAPSPGVVDAAPAELLERRVMSETGLAAVRRAREIAAQSREAREQRRNARQVDKTL